MHNINVNGLQLQIILVYYLCMEQLLINQRQTKYCKSIEHALSQCGHATNAELLKVLHERYPDVSATTVHRATARLAERGAIATAPPALDGSMRYDANTSPHDHFCCTKCGMLKDADIKDKITPILKASIKDCGISGRLTVTGICNKCMEGNEQ